MAFGTTLDGLATRNKAGSGLSTCCPGCCWGPSNHREDYGPGGVYKASGDPPLLERPFPLAQFVCYVLFSLSESVYSLL
jgi:hypothetical protein